MCLDYDADKDKIIVRRYSYYEGMRSPNKIDGEPIDRALFAEKLRDLCQSMAKVINYKPACDEKHQKAGHAKEIPNVHNLETAYNSVAVNPRKGTNILHIIFGG